MDKKQLKSLQVKWYKKLKDTGFEDIEHNENYIKVWGSRYYLKNPDQFAAKQEYFRLAGQFLHNYAFKSENEKFIWSHHSEGQTLRFIFNEMKEHRMATGGLNKIMHTIHALQDIMFKQVREANARDD